MPTSTSSTTLGRLGAGVRPVAVALALALTLVGGCAAPWRDAAAPPGGPTPSRPSARRAFTPMLGGRWIGNAVAYGPYRDGQAPGGTAPSRDQIREDLRLLARHWNLIRIYGATGPAEDILSVIRAERLPVRVMLGAWLGAEDRRDSTGAVLESFPAVRDANLAEIEAVVRLANAFGDVVCAIAVGNETQVFWSDHRLAAARLIEHIRSVRTRTRVPVTTADDYNFWNKPESDAVAAEVDFLVMHAHPLWNGKRLDEALAWTEATTASIRSAHPGRTVVLGETGWATRRHDQGEQARLMLGRTGEGEQKAFFTAVTAWARATRTTTFFFEAFDENWKGGSHPDEVEKHWGLYRADRTPKAAVAPGR